MSSETNEVKATTAVAKRLGDEATEMGFASAESFALLQRAATILSQSSLVPEIYRGNLPNCIIALNMASRMRADPLMVMQNLYIVYNRPSWSAVFLIATFNQCGRFSALRYEWKDEPYKPEWGCRAWAVEKETGEKLYGSWITWKLVNDEGWYNKNGSKWKTMPEQMFMYRAGAWFVKAHAPELSMGLPTQEEIEDINLIQTAPGVYEPQPMGEGWKEEGGEADKKPMDKLKESLRKRSGSAKKAPAATPAAQASEEKETEGVLTQAEEGGPRERLERVLIRISEAKGPQIRKAWLEIASEQAGGKASTLADVSEAMLERTIAQLEENCRENNIA